MMLYQWSQAVAFQNQLLLKAALTPGTNLKYLTKRMIFCYSFFVCINVMLAQVLFVSNCCACWSGQWKERS